MQQVIDSKYKWKKVRFDKIARNISERIEPQKTNLKYYVGLEHLDSENLHVKRWGSPLDVIGTKLKVYKGDMIFGKRRAYQRKAAIAPFDGVCSAHVMVLRANQDVMDKNLFPFFLHSNSFMHKAIDISVGGLSPTINWKTLCQQEFLLPPKEQQARVAELLWAVNEVVERHEEMKIHLLAAFNSVISKISKGEDDWQKMKLSDILSFNYGQALKATKREVGVYDVVGSAGIIGKHSQFLIEAPGITVGRAGNAGQVFWLENNFWPIDTVYWVKVNLRTVDLKFAYYTLVASDLSKLSIVTAVPGLNREDALSKTAYIPTKEKQKVIVQELQKIEEAKCELIAHTNKSRKLQAQLINAIF